MKNCHAQAVEVLSKSLPSLGDALRFTPLEVQEEASVIAAAFFSFDVRQTCLQDLHSSPGTLDEEWFHKRPIDVVEVEDISTLKEVFVQHGSGIINAVDYVLNKAKNPELSRLVQEVVVAIQITHWINNVSSQPERLLMIPLALREEFALHLDVDLLNKKVSEHTARALAVLMGEARQAYVRLYHHLGLLDPNLRLGVYLAAKFQEALLDEIVWAKFDLFSGVQEVSSLRRRFMTFKAKRYVGKQT